MEHSKGEIETRYHCGCGYAYIGSKTIFAMSLEKKGEANFHHLVKCWNNHYALLAACKLGLKLAQMLNHPDEHHIEQAIAEAKKS